MEYADVLGTFTGFSYSFYIFFAALAILIDGIVIFLLVAQKYPRNGVEFNKVMLHSLALCDVLYEAATSTLFWQFDSCQVSEKCKILYFIYISLNLCTLFHIAAEIGGKMMNRVTANGAFWSGSAWLSAIIIACIYVNKDNGCIDVTSMMSLGKFKAFGHVLFAVIFFSGVFVILLLVWFSKRKHKVTRTPTQQEPCHNNLLLTMNNVLLSCIFLAFLVGWYAWVIVGIDSRILMAIEIMKSFEVIRVGARLLCPLTIFCTFCQSSVRTSEN
jgi:hypothetical protein